MAPFKVLSTKKIDPALVARAREGGIHVIENEFISIHPLTATETTKELVKWVGNESQTYIAFTSQHAVEAVSSYLSQPGNHDVRWMVFCLEGATKTKAAQHHLTIIATAANAKDLAGEVINAGVREIVFFCGNKRRDELPDLLNAAGVRVHEVIVYETVETPSYSETVDGILFFSPSAVHSFFSVNQPTSNTVCFAIGETTAAAIRDYTTNKIITSEGPRQETIMEQIELYFRNFKCHE